MTNSISHIPDRKAAIRALVSLAQNAANIAVSGAYPSETFLRPDAEEFLDALLGPEPNPEIVIAKALIEADHVTATAAEHAADHIVEALRKSGYQIRRQ